MARISPPGARAAIEDLGEGLEIRIPARKNWFIILFLALWLCGWGAGEITVAGQLLAGTREAAFMLLWITMWTIGGAFAIAIWLWNVAGIERLTVTPTELRVRREVFGVGLSREYDALHVRNLRVSQDSWNFFDMRGSMRLWGLGGGPITFDYGTSTVRAGRGVEEAEAATIVERVAARFPRLRGE